MTRTSSRTNGNSKVGSATISRGYEKPSFGLAGTEDEKNLALLKQELLELLPPTIFFFIAIGLLMLTKRLILQQYGIGFSDFAAVLIGALIVGKVVLIADALPFINKFPEKPLIYNVVWKTIIYVLAAFLVRLAEHLVPLIIKYGSFREAIARVADEIVWPHFWIIYLWLSVLLFVYCALRELIGAIGRDQVLRLFFGMERA
jgi:hypothetical protein